MNQQGICQMTKNRSVIRATDILEYLFANDFSAKTLSEIDEHTNVPATSSWRILKSLEAQGWVIEKKISGKKNSQWEISRKIVGIAHAFERQALNKVHSIKNEFRDITGRDLNA